MKDEQVTLRLPRALARQLARRARELGEPKSHVVREALQHYLAPEPLVAIDPAAAWERVKHMVGAFPLDHDAIERDEIARQIRDHNWRE
jgi:predicted DNA-binding protein